MRAEGEPRRYPRPVPYCSSCSWVIEQCASRDAHIAHLLSSDETRKPLLLLLLLLLLIPSPSVAFSFPSQSKGIADDPVQTDCGHIFCRACLLPVSECPRDSLRFKFLSPSANWPFKFISPNADCPFKFLSRMAARPFTFFSPRAFLLLTFLSPSADCPLELFYSRAGNSRKECRHPGLTAIQGSRESQENRESLESLESHDSRNPGNQGIMRILEIPEPR